jgi:hypothetical protein
VANPNPSPATRFGAGQPINLNGRPKEASITARIRAQCERTTDDGRTIAERIGDRFVAEALKGKFPFAKEVMERNDGKVTDRVEHSGPGGGPIVVNATVRDQASIENEAWRQQKIAEISERPSRPPTAP